MSGERVKPEAAILYVGHRLWWLSPLTLRKPQVVKKSVYLLGAALCALLPVVSYAQETIVTITREPVAISRLGQSVSVLDSADIERFQSTLVADLITRTPGVHVVRNGGAGSAAAASIRGGTADQTLYVFDGIALNDPSQVGGGTNLGLMASDDIARIEIVRAPLSTLWGANALGGVVSLSGYDAQGPYEADIKAQGFDGYGSVYAGVGGQTGRLTWRIAAASQEDEGVSAFGGGTEKDGFAQTHVSLRAAYALKDNLTARVLAFKTHSRNDYDGYPAPTYSFADTNDYGKTDVIVSAAGLTHTFSGGEQTLSLSETKTERRDYDNFGPSFSADGQIWASDYRLRFTAGQTRFVAGARYQRDHIFIPSLWGGADLSRAVSQLSLFGQATHDFGPAAVGLSVRQDDSTSFGGHTTAALSVNVPVTETLTLRASAGQGYKAPSLYQLYSDYGNEGLSPEEAVTYEFGGTWSLSKGYVGLSVFKRETDNLIGFEGCFTDPTFGLCPSRPFGYYINVNQSEASGFEVEFDYALTARLNVSGNYSQIDTRNESPGLEGLQLARAPEQTANLNLDWSPYEAVVLGLGLRHVGKSFDDSFNTRELKAFNLIDLRAQWQFSPTLTVFGRVENAGDSRYETAAGYGSVGRRLWVGLRATTQGHSRY